MTPSAKISSSTAANHPTGLTPIHSPVHTQQAEIIDRLSVEETTKSSMKLTSPMNNQKLSRNPFRSSFLSLVALLSAPLACAHASRCPRQQGQGGVHASAGSDRHLKLRLACAVDGRSAQQIVTDALDQFLAAMPELDTMAKKAKRKG